MLNFFKNISREGIMCLLSKTCLVTEPFSLKVVKGWVLLPTAVEEDELLEESAFLQVEWQ